MRKDGLLARKLSLRSVDGDFTRAMNNNSSSSSRWNSGSSFCDGNRREGMKTKPKRKRKALCCVPGSFSPSLATPQLLTVGCVMCCTNRKRDREFRSGVGWSVGNADDVERTNDSCVLSLRWCCCCCCWLVTTTLSIFSLHVGLFSAHAVLLTPRVRSAEE